MSRPASERAPWLRVVREAGAKPPERIAIRSPQDVAALIGKRSEAELVECIYLVALDAQNQTIATQEVTRGLLDTSQVHPREVYRLAILLGAASIIVAHNHPSGSPAPSADDRAVTRQLADAGRAIDIPLADHVIVCDGGERFFSFAEAGLLE